MSMLKNFRYKIKFKKKHSMAFIIAMSLLVVLFVQSLVLFFNFVIFKTDHKLSQNTYRYLLEKVDNRSKELERHLTQIWSNTEYMKHLKEFSQKIYDEHINKGEDFKINSDIANSLLDMVELMEVSGAFIVFDDKPEMLGIKRALHFIDTNLYTKYSDKSDIMIEVGDEKLASDMDVSLESNWVPYVNTKVMSRTIYEKAIKLAKTSVEKERDGFWFSPEDISSKYGARNIYYIQPLFDRYTGAFYGVIGIEIGHQMIEDILRYTELSKNGTGAYMLLNEKSVSAKYTDYDVISVQGPYIKRFIKDNEASTYNIRNKYYSENFAIRDNEYLTVLEVGSEVSEELIGIQRPIRLSSISEEDDTGNQWYLMGVISKTDLEMYSKELVDSLIEIMLVSFLIGGVVIYFIAYAVSYPLTKLSEDIKQSYTQGTLRRIKHINITEVDNIIDTIGDLSSNLLSSSKKYQRILEAAGIPIVAIEKDNETGIVYKLGQLSSIFPNYIENEQFEFKSDSKYHEEKQRELYGDTVIIDSIYDLEKDTQIDIRKKMWKGESYYIRVITKELTGYIGSYEDTIEDIENINQKKSVTLQVIMDYTKEIMEKIKIQKERDFDILTGLLNRLSFREKVEDYISSDIQKNKKAAMIMFDLDDLKYINDTYGHDFGDNYLKGAGDIIGLMQGKGAYVARVSGDEFFAFVEYEEDKEEVRAKIQVIKEMLSNNNINSADGISMKIRATAGIAWYPENSDNYEELHKMVDFAMYTAKHSQKGTVSEFDKDLYEKNYILISGREDLNRFIEERQVRFAFQPIVDARTGEIFAYEALMRSTSPKIKGVGDIMRLARSQSKMTEIETLTFEGVFDIVLENLDDFKGKHIFMNSIASTVVRSSTIKKMREIYNKIDYSRVVIEIIESDDVDISSLEMKQNFRKEMGFNIAIDDFGAGYATESWLLQVNPDFVKIDMELIRDIDEDTERQLIVGNIMKYTKERGIKVICEGVETHAEMSQLISMGADYIQGYYLAKPDFEIKDISEEKKREIQVLYILNDGGGGGVELYLKN